jgi:spermidine synthase
VTVHNADAMTWLEEQEQVWDLIVVDLPDPRNYAIGKLYTRAFYRLVRRHLAETGALVVQSTSPYAAPHAFWCIEQTIADAEYTTYPYHAYVPSFGDWGFVLALPRERPRPTQIEPGLEGLRYLDDSTLEALFAFPVDQQPPEGLEVNRLGEQPLVGYHERDWRQVDD